MTTRVWTVLELLKTTAEYFGKREVQSPRLAAEWLLADVLHCKRVDLYLRTEQAVDERALESYRGLVRAYAAGEPLQYVVGDTEFMGCTLKCDRRALIPRPETEILVDLVAKRLRASAAPSSPARVLELGAGSGAIAIALAKLVPQATVWTVDVSPEAAALARENAGRNGVEARVHVCVMDRFTALAPELDGALDCVVSNPPYVTTAEMAELPAVVRDHEPALALHGGADGLDFYRGLCRDGVRLLAKGGLLAVEIGAAQADAVRDLFAGADLHDVTLHRDYAGRDRVLLGVR
jgi:release factor glutamine methyltransferase